MPTWTPEHPVGAELAARLVHDQFPDLRDHPPHRIGEGWDNDMWRFGDWAFRFPRRRMAVQLIEVEIAVLTRLSARLPFPIPHPQRIGRATEAFGYPWAGYRFLDGTTADRAELDADARRALVPDLVAFTEALAAIDPEEARGWGVPEDSFRADLERMRRITVERLDALSDSPAGDLRADVERLLARPIPPSTGRTLLHGDPYARHLLLDERNRLCGVIDWGDVCVGDRIIDRGPLAFQLTPPDAREPLLAGLDSSSRHRARVRATCHAVALVVYAHDVGDAPLLREGACALSNALAG